MTTRINRLGAPWMTILAMSAGCAEVALEEAGSQDETVVGDAVAGLDTTQQQAFTAGKEAFAEQEGLADGLGPVFNDKSCGACHFVGATGGSGTQFEVRAGRVVNGVFESLGTQGGQLFDLFSVANLTGNEQHDIPNCTLAKNGEPVPSAATVTAKRRTTALFGLGFVDVTPDQTFLDLAAGQPSPIRGHANVVQNFSAGTTTVGKFGWKAQVPSLFQFSGDAYLNEMGITNPQFSSEQPPLGNADTIANCDLLPESPGVVEDDGEDVKAFTNFMMMLAPVPPLAQDANAQAGDALFTQLGCDGCHVRTLTAGTSPIAAINNQAYHPFSDFLLHDMGSLGDGIGDNGAAGLTEMRTAPLWGLRLVDAKHQLLHDGRATSLSDAILRHDGQALTSRQAFSALSSTDQNKVLAFLKTL
jgi:CxxC motif-containing protein (DUF1111 family)